MCIRDSYRGGGWGSNTPESVEAVLQFPREEGLYLENVYNSKVVAGKMCIRDSGGCGP